MCRISNAEPNDVDAIFALITELEEMQFDKKQFTTVYNSLQRKLTKSQCVLFCCTYE
jgi:hypothetical protein